MRAVGGWIALTPEISAKLAPGPPRLGSAPSTCDAFGRRLPELRAPAQRLRARQSRRRPVHGPPGGAERPGRDRGAPGRRVLGSQATPARDLSSDHLARANPVYEPPTRADAGALHRRRGAAHRGRSDDPRASRRRFAGDGARGGAGSAASRSCCWPPRRDRRRRVAPPPGEPPRRRSRRRGARVHSPGDGRTTWPIPDDLAAGHSARSARRWLRPTSRRWSDGSPNGLVLEATAWTACAVPGIPGSDHRLRAARQPAAREEQARRPLGLGGGHGPLGVHARRLARGRPRRRPRRQRHDLIRVDRNGPRRQSREIARRIFRACRQLGLADGRGLLRGRSRARPTCATRTRPSRSAARRRARAISAPTGSSQPRGGPGPTRSIPATAFSPRTGGSPTAMRAGRARVRRAHARRHPDDGRQDRGAATHERAPACPFCPGASSAVADRAGAAGRRARGRLPVMLKAAAGGGGIGMARVASAGDLARRVRDGRAARAGRVRHRRALRRALPRAAPARRGQVFGDGRGRSCTCTSASARSSAAIRSWWKSRRRRACRPRSRPGSRRRRLPAHAAIGYTNAGTMEFLVDEGGELLLPRDERPSTGRASGDRGSDRSRPGRRPAPGRRRRAAAVAPGRDRPASSGDRVPRVR